MSEDLPLTRAFLKQLLQLEAGDERLPLSLLVRMYREQLRMPLYWVLMYASSTDWEARVAAAYPHVPEAVFRGQVSVMDAEDVAPRWTQRDVEDIKRFESTNPALARVLWVAIIDRPFYDPAIVLHHMTWEGRNPEGLACVLESELAILPEAATMLMQMARDVRDTVVLAAEDA
jgi:hypothetical protein